MVMTSIESCGRGDQGLRKLAEISGTGGILNSVQQLRRQWFLKQSSSTFRIQTLFLL